MPQHPDLSEWDDDVTVSEEEDYAALVRAIQWARGFGLLFVQCSLSEGERLIARVKADVTEKEIAVLRLEDEIEDLYEAVQTHPGINSVDVLFITGLEKSLTQYIKPGYGSEGGYYAKDTVPTLLGRLNLRREQFREDFPVCFVFVVPSYAMKYLTRRAADFFDWRSGIWEFVPSAEDRQKVSERILQEANYQKYLSWTPQQRRDRLFEIEELLSNPDDSTVNVIGLRYEQGNILMADRNLETAIAAYDAALESSSDDSFSLENKGHTLNQLERYEAVIALFSLENKGNALNQLERYEAAIDVYDMALAVALNIALAVTSNIALAVKSNRVGMLCMKSHALSKLGRFEEAITACDMALAVKSDHINTLLIKGRALNQLERFEEAIASLDELLAIKPDDAHALNSKGYALNKLEHYEEALTAFNEALASNPNYADALDNQGIVLGKLGRHEEALMAFDAALASNPDHANALSNKGFTLYTLGKYEAAVACFNKALKINPDHELAIKNRKLALSALESTFRYEQSAIRLLEEECAALTSEGMRLYRLCRFEEAIPHYDQALAKKADYTPALHHKGMALAKLGHPTAAIDCYDKALKIQPDDHDILCERGQAFHATGRNEDALKDYDRALTIQPKSAKARMGKQEVRRGMADLQTALPASTAPQQPPRNLFQRCITACAKRYTALWNLIKSLFRL